MVRYHSHGNGGWSLVYLDPHQPSEQAQPRVGMCLYPKEVVSLKTYIEVKIHATSDCSTAPAASGGYHHIPLPKEHVLLTANAVAERCLAECSPVQYHMQAFMQQLCT